MTLPTTGQIWPVGAIPHPEPPSFTIAALPITTLREATTRTAQSVVSLGLPNGLTVAAAI